MKIEVMKDTIMIAYFLIEVIKKCLSRIKSIFMIFLLWNN